MQYSTHIGKFIAEKDNWKELLSSQPYNLKISVDNGYVLFKYDMRTSDFSYQIVKKQEKLFWN